jgi:hypothetical protein
MSKYCDHSIERPVSVFPLVHIQSPQPLTDARLGLYPNILQFSIAKQIVPVVVHSAVRRFCVR